VPLSFASPYGCRLQLAFGSQGAMAASSIALGGAGPHGSQVD